MIRLIVLLLMIGLAGCSIEGKLNRNYKGKTIEKLMLEMGRPAREEIIGGGRKIEIYEKIKFLKAASINTGQFQYDKFESPKTIKTETYRFYLSAGGIIEDVKYEVHYQR